MLDGKTESLRGAMFMMLGAAAFTTNDLFEKLFKAQLPLSQTLVLRGSVVRLLIAGFYQFYQIER